ncbi:MAG: TonB-dependent receptor, partial [Bacteroidota bacterium]|nr:TonB-dependent receptor [Bacteroidota bacterium]
MPRCFLAALLLVLALCSGTIVCSQSRVGGFVFGTTNQPLAGASVTLLLAKDSSLVKGSLTSPQGRYVLETVTPGAYLIAVSYTGFKQVYTPAFTISKNEDKEVAAVSLVEKADALKEVTLVAKRPLFEQKVDRMVINVANNITAAGSTVLDVLERSPNIVVDRQNNALSINGKDGVVVMINGKINRMPISSLVQMLASMPSDNVERVEVITTPPANFDAEGNAGYVNIVLKRNLQFGTNGSYSLTAGYSRGPITTASGNINYRKGRWNVYGNYA